MKVCFQSGKGVGKLVPTDITQDVEPALEILSDAHIRHQVGLWTNNIFPFANIGSDDHYGTCGSTDIRKICTEAGVTGHLTAIAARHRASMYAGFDLPEGQRQIWYDHEGHSEQINKWIYQCSRALNELTQVGTFLERIDQGHVAPQIGKTTVS